MTLKQLQTQLERINSLLELLNVTDSSWFTNASRQERNHTARILISQMTLNHIPDEQIIATLLTALKIHLESTRNLIQEEIINL